MMDQRQRETILKLFWIEYPLMKLNTIAFTMIICRVKEAFLPVEPTIAWKKMMIDQNRELSENRETEPNMYDLSLSLNPPSLIADLQSRSNS